MNRSTAVSTGRTVLVVEDEVELSRLFIEVLQDAGHTVVTADSVTDALSALTGQRFDAAILDVELRDGPVFPVADRLAALGTPFLFASAVYYQVVPREHQQVPFVTKPFDIRLLQQRVAEALTTQDPSSGRVQASSH
ncbi:response regulator [Stenotrophomonas maltophilia]|jgi:DNA-binding response OmpR family regulator|uniref:Response regulator n=1 Tax=Stenotrophomonas maltophilia TaxID=40324 RepID=A0A246HKU5_STEMA|nr:response regulator [Stenotrophomonas maltophilia]OWQ52329.1 response regulator [Stenotrophomonas maltophilia]HAV70703.1 response regulator [Stenotrophomonas sp.]